MSDADKDAKNEAGRKDAPTPQEELGKYGDKPRGRLSGTGKPPVDERKAGRDDKA
jgi:hypothetical protein